MLQISTTNFEDKSKPIYFLTTMIHAREWVTTPVALYSIYRLVENLRAEDRDVLNDVDWIIMPLLNPDGYEYTHTDVSILHCFFRVVDMVLLTQWLIVSCCREFDTEPARNQYLYDLRIVAPGLAVCVSEFKCLQSNLRYRVCMAINTGSKKIIFQSIRKHITALVQR